MEPRMPLELPDDYFIPNNILLANISSVKRDSYLDDNVSDEAIRTAMEFIQDSIIEKVTGSCLMNQIKLLIDQCVIREPIYCWYRELLDTYIFPILTNGVQSELAAHLTLKERNQGVIRNNDTQHLQYPVVSDIKYLKSQFDRKTDFYIHRAVKWLKCNKVHFSELCGCCFCCDCETAPFQKPYSIGLNLDIVSHNLWSRHG